MRTTKIVKIFYCCSDSAKDEEMLQKLENHLSASKWEGLSTSWHRKMISPGKEWEKEIDTNLKTADIILVLISSEFTASDYHWNVLAKQAMKQHKAKTSRVITILLRPVDDYWKIAFPNVKVLPKGGKPITEWRPYDKAFADIATGIREVVEELTDSTFHIKKILYWIRAIAILVIKAAGKTLIYVARATDSYFFRTSRYRRRNRVSKIPIRILLIILVGGMFMLFISQQSDISKILSSDVLGSFLSRPNSTLDSNNKGWIWLGIIKNSSGSFSAREPLIIKQEKIREYPTIEPPIVPSPGDIVTIKYIVYLRKEKFSGSELIDELIPEEKVVILKVEPLSKSSWNSPYIELMAQVRKCNYTCNH
ncbi:hypothetical protein Ava_3815 [Trichormus variabilis ATCC 29413]|uniref:TIR domain-containing protein n=2 Tax=Anabaena variabilis TaxID=264691 RepID=Q3M6G6_TRIV2|nr:MULTISPECIES: toll/interleukin-1 receptor domain-containing protein [Nostocaceae]ABA23420.1 hypothetical protein Ava_3815 [Trichormus variabilis ATCC 29413]MBC1216877.1 toll/interleukin-1 receptor domain-containing protein [Trichormus variabilis ARAD]MBC1257046.1 toll/interleukin-1 receptor domain-containing protein [Trichormus variabilis V5]MBC1269540.1 toll/interleukin-1 receptor domain-containing protein [Trichormus variabilis FSR]MBC1305085.1 toll/interleukin-1 receptor domain-containin